MGRAGKFWFTLLVLCLGLLVAGNIAINRGTGAMVRKLTGFDLTFEKLRVGLFRPYIEIQDLTLFNPPDFNERECLVIRRAYLRYSPLSLFRQEIHAYALELDMPKAVVVRLANGDSNLGRLGKSAKPKDGKPSPEPPAPPEAEKPPRTVRIDKLTLKLGSAQVVTYPRNGGAPAVRTLEMNIERTYTNVTDLNKAAMKLGAEIVANEAVQVVNKVQDKLKKGGDMEKLEKSANKLGEKLNRAFTPKKKLGE